MMELTRSIVLVLLDILEIHVRPTLTSAFPTFVCTARVMTELTRTLATVVTLALQARSATSVLKVAGTIPFRGNVRRVGYGM